MSLQEIKQKFLEIIQKQNNLKGRVLDDFTEASEIYVELYGTYPECYYANCHPDIDKTIEKIKNVFECFFPGMYDCYKDEDGSLIFDKVMYDTTVVTDQGFLSIDKEGITIYTNSTKFRDDIFSCYEGVVEDHPCEVYWVSSGQNGFGASKLTLRDGLFNIESHYNDDFNYAKVNDFINSNDSGLVILHGVPGSGNYLKYSVLFILV